MERILANQEEIANALADLGVQIEELAELTAAIPATTVELDERVEARAVLRSMLVRYDEFTRADSFGPVDRDTFDEARTRMEDAISRHLAIAETVGQSYDLIGSLDVLGIALDTLVSLAGIAGYVDNDDKRALRVPARLLQSAMSKVFSGAAQPGVKTFRERGTELYIAKRDSVHTFVNALEEWRGASTNRDMITSWFGDVGDNPFSSIRIFTGSEKVGIVAPGDPPNSNIIRHYDNATLEREIIPGTIQRPNHFDVSLSMPGRFNAPDVPVIVHPTVSDALAVFNSSARELHMHEEVALLLGRANGRVGQTITAIDELRAWDRT